MPKLKIAVWLFVLANAVIAYCVLNLSGVFRHVFESTIEGGIDALPLLSKNYLRHEQWICAVFTIPLLIAAAIVSSRRALGPGGTLVFGATAVLNISVQIFFAATAFSQPFIPVLTHFEAYGQPRNDITLGSVFPI